MSINKNSNDFFTLLTYSVATNSIEDIKNLIENGYSINKWDNTGNLPQHWIRSKEVLEYFLENNFIKNIDLPNKHSQTLLFNVVNSKFLVNKVQIDLVDRLVRLGANINCKNQYGDNLLHICSHKKNKELFRYFVKHGLDINEKNMFGEKPII